MPKIKIKVKYIIIIALLFTVMWVGKSFIISEVVYTRGENYIADGEKEVGIAYLRKYIQDFPESKKTLNAFEKVLNKLTHTSNFLIYVNHGRSGTSVKALAELEKLRSLNQDFSNLKKYHQGQKIAELQLQLAQFNYQANNIHKSKELYRDLLKSNKSEIKKIATVLLSLLHLELGEIEKANQIMKQTKYNFTEIQKVKNWLAFIDRNPSNFHKLSDDGFYNSKFYRYFHRISWAEKYLKKNIQQKVYNSFKGNQTNLKGYVKKGSQPLANTFVLLQKKEFEDSQSHHSGSLEHTADYLTITDKNGYYELKDVEPGYYYVGVGLTFNRVSSYLINHPEDIEVKSGQVIERNISFKPTINITEPPQQKAIKDYQSFELAWESYPSAEYYKVYLGISTNGSTFFPLVGDKIYKTETNVEITPEFFENSQGSISFDCDGISPGCIIGYKKIPFKLVYTVYAYDKNGDYLSKNLDYYQRYSFDWQGMGELNKGDKLLLDRKYEKAIKAYHKLLENGQQNEDIYKALGRIYKYGYKFEGTEKVGLDYKKARKYLSKAYQIGKDKELLSPLIGLNIRASNWEKAEYYLNKELKNKPDNGHIWLRKGRLKLYQYNLIKAENALIKALKKAETGQEYLIILYLLQGQKEKALKVEEEYPNRYGDHKYEKYLKESYQAIDWEQLDEFFNKIKAGNVKEAINELPESETGRFYKTLALVLQPKDKMKDDFYKAYNELNNHVLKTFIKKLGKQLISSAFPRRYR